jgi:hypothetical protein
MKYLLPCPFCGTTIPVESGQAGQILHCTCGKPLEVPTIRGLQKLTPVADEKLPAVAWTRRKGLLFLGSAMAVIALVAAGCIVALRPALIDRSKVSIPFDNDAIRREVAAYTPAESMVRYEAIISPMPAPITKQLESGEVPSHLLPCARLLVDFEGPGAQALAPKEGEKLRQQLVKLSESVIVSEDERKKTNDWLWLLAVAGMFGLGLAGSTLLIRPRQRTRIDRQRK